MILRKSFKKSLKLFTLLSLLLMMLLQPTLNYTVTQYIIKDLESNDETSFAIEAAAWTASRKRTTNVYYKCDTTYLLGGYGVLGSTTSPYQAGDYYQRVYTNLPLHNSIHFSLNFWAIDSWDSETFQMSFDGTIITGWTLVLTPFPADLCGVLNGSWRELPNILIYGTVAHRASTVTFRVISGLDEPSDNESFGFRELTFTFDQDTSFTTSLCATAPIALPDKTCACTPGQFKDSTVSSCTTCPDPCLTCYGGTTSDCYACKNLPNVFYDGKTCRYCDSPCATCSLTSTRCTSCVANYYYFPSTNQCYLQCPWPLNAIGNTCYSPCAADQYVNPDKSCAPSCSAPFVEGYSTTVVKICKTPCSPVEFLYWDGSCQHDCGSPLTVTYGIGNQKICNHNCGVNYLNFDGNCQATCDPPYIPRMQSGRLICMKPCPLNQYLYWNGDCLDSCTALLTPVTLSTGVKTCTYKCLDTEYLYWDSVCRSDCPYPLRTRIEKGKKYCDYPTTSTNFLYWDGSSEIGCVLPLKQRTIGTSVVRKFCDFACTEWEYLYWDNTCGTECGFPLKQRISKGRQYCDFPCTGTNSILYWDGSCQSSCVAPLTQRPEKSKIFCDYKCSDEDFLYADGSCAPTCDSPFTERTTMNRKFCDFPCSAPKPYRYWNDTCQPACNLPLVLSHKYGQPFCNFPCKDGKYLNYDNTCLEFCDLPLKAREFGLEKYCSPSCAVNTDFYYWNGSCISTCSLPLVQQTLGAQKWCVYPCKANQFLYIDGSCGDICDLGLIASEEAGFKYCNNPCYAADEFLYWNGTCENSCDAPFRKEITSIGKNCKKPCDNDLFYYDEKTGICSERCNSPSQNKSDLYLVCGPGITVDEAASSTILDLILKAPSRTGEVTLVTIVKQMEYIRYIDMDVPPRLERFLQSKGRNILSLRYGQQDTESLTKEFLSRPLPEVFEKRGVHSHFLINFWQEITSWIVVLIATVLFIILEGFCRMNGWVYARIFFEKLNVITKWNFCLILIMTSVNDIIFYGIIELRSWKSGSSGFSTFSFEVSLVALGIFIGLIFGLMHFARALRDARERSVLDRSNEELQEFLTKRRDCQVLFRGFRDSTSPNRYFLVIYIIRMSLPALITALLYKFPMVQIIIYIVINFAILAYVILRRPLARIINFVQLIIFEIIMLIINICLLLLKLGYGDTHTKTLIGDFVIAGNSMINLIAIVFLAFKVLGGIKILFGYLSNQPKKQWTIFLQLIPLYLQQGGMGFEEMFIDSKAAEAYNQDQYLIQDKEVTPEMLGRKTAKVKSGKIFPENAVDDLPSREKAARLYSRLKSQRELNDQASSNNLNLEENSPGSLVIHPQKVEEENHYDEAPSYSPTIKGLDDGGERLLQNSNRGGSDDSPLRARKNIKRIQNLLNRRGTLDAVVGEH